MENYPRNKAIRNHWMEILIYFITHGISGIFGISDSKYASISKGGFCFCKMKQKNNAAGLPA